MKTYILYVEGVQSGTLKAYGHNQAEKKAQKLHPGKTIQVEYTEV